MLFVNVSVYVSERFVIGVALRPVCDMLMGTTPTAATPVADTAANAESWVTFMIGSLVLCQEPSAGICVSECLWNSEIVSSNAV